MAEKVTRRRFLKTGCVVTAAVGVTACGGFALAASYQPKIDQPSVSYGTKTAANRFLVTYASKAGSTAETAARMGELISGHNLAVDVLPVGQVTDLTPYRSVVLGSAIRAGKVLPEAMTFIEKNQAALQQKPFSLFVLCATLATDNADTRKTVAAYLDPVRAVVTPTREGLFAGVLDPNKLPLLERLMVFFMKAPEGDFRKWDQINAWGESAASI
jgi:menaquinone-dependent protoporphyrinogen oxidase